MNNSLNTLLEPALNFTEFSKRESNLASPKYFKNKIVLKDAEFIENSLKELIQKDFPWAEYEKKFINYFLELLEKDMEYLNLVDARRLSALSMQAVMERAELIKNNLLINFKEGEVYKEEFMKVIFIIESNKKIIANLKKFLVSASPHKTDLNNYFGALSNLFWIYQFLNGEREVNIDSIMQVTSELKQKELKTSYYVPFN